MVGRRVVACVLLACACTTEPDARSDGLGGASGKADDAAGFDPSLSTHQNEVNACLVAAAKDRAVDAVAAEIALYRCVHVANDKVWPELQAQLPEDFADEYSGEVSGKEGDEVQRHIDRLRATQTLVCDVFSPVLGGEDDDAAELMKARCMAQSEVHTANLIDGHFELGGERLGLVTTVARFARCEDNFDDAQAEGFTPPAEVGPLPDDTPTTEIAWMALLHNERRDCMKAEDAELRVGWARDLEVAEAHADETFALRMRHVSRSFERESRAGRLLCDLFGLVSESDRELTAALCTADSTLQAGMLYDTLLGTPEVEEPQDPADPEPPTDPRPPEDGKACYPGADGSFETCLPLVYPTTEIDDYNYAAPLNGNANYRQPIAFIDLDAVDGQTRLSKDFTLAEVAHRWKGRFAVIQPHAVASLQRLRDDVGSISVNSGYRSPKYNRGVGGATYSRHMYGDGFDMDPNAVPLSTLEDACQNNGGFLVEYTSHVHCDFRFAPVDESFFGAL